MSEPFRRPEGGPRRFIDAANDAIEGILHAAMTQRHMRWHFLSAIVILVTVLFLRVTAVEFALLALAISVVLCAELLNTAIESVVDLVSPEYHPLAKAAKDVAAGAVLVSAFSAVVMGYLILSRYLFGYCRRLFTMIGSPGELAIIATLLTVVILVVMVKALVGRGRPLEGGLPSGHSAIAFAIATLVTLHTADPLIAILTLMLAVMVSHSRLLLRIHTLTEVILGGGMGILVAVLMVLFFR
ncbi:MAG: diacylglycerol kinase [Desulfuromonadia bacterium]